MKTLISTLFLAGSLLIGGCGDKEEVKEDPIITDIKKQIEINKLQLIDSVALNNSTSIKITKEGFNQYNNGLLVREVQVDKEYGEEDITDNFYNDKNQKIKSIDSFKSKDEKTGKETIEKTDSTFYEYNDKGQLIKTILFSDELGVGGKQINFYKYDEKGNKIERKIDENGMIYLDKYKYDNKGKLIKEESSYWGQITYTLFPNDFTKIVIRDMNSDGLIDIARKEVKK